MDLLRFFKKKFFLVMLLVVLAVFLRALPKFGVFPGLDSGIVLNGGNRLLDSQVVYKDFFSFWTPGSFLISAFTIFLFGNSVLAMSCISFFVQVVGVFCVMYLINNLTLDKKTKYIYWGIIAYFVNLTVIFLDYNHKLWSQLFFLVSLVFATLYVKNKNRLILYALGFSIGLTAFITQNEGFVIFCSTLFLLFWLKSKIKDYLVLLLGVITVWFPFIVYLIINNAFGDFVNQVIIFPFTGYQTITHNAIAIYILNIKNNIFTTSVVSKLIVPAGLVIFGFFLIVLKLFYIKKKKVDCR